MDGPVEDIGSRSCVTRFVKTLLSIMEHGVKPHSKHLTEYFAFLYEFAKMGEEEVSVVLFQEYVPLYFISILLLGQTPGVAGPTVGHFHRASHYPQEANTHRKSGCGAVRSTWK